MSSRVLQVGSARGRTAVTALALVLLSVPAGAQEFKIRDRAIACWPADAFPVVAATIEPRGEARTMRVYYRAEQYPDYYYVEAALGREGRAAVAMPRPSAETRSVVYYLEATSPVHSVRTPVRAVPVASSEECHLRDPGVARYTGDNPKILVRPVRADAAPLSPGFQAAGMVVMGKDSDDGRGLGGVLLGAAAGAAGATVIARGIGGGGESATSAPPGSGPPSSIGPGATTTIGSTTTVPATTTVPGPTTSSTTTTSAPSSTTTSVNPGADMAVTLSDSVDPVRVGVLLTYRAEVVNNGPQSATAVRLTVTLPSSLTFNSATGGSCTGSTDTVVCDFGTLVPGEGRAVDVVGLTTQVGTITARATVTANEPDPFPSNNQDTETTTVTLLGQRTVDVVPVSLQAHLLTLGLDPSDRGEVLAGGQAFVVDNGAPATLHFDVVGPGESVIEAFLVASSGRSGTWRFDLSGTGGFVPGSILVESGEVLTLESRAVVFRVSGVAGERSRFRFRVSR